MSSDFLREFLSDHVNLISNKFPNDLESRHIKAEHLYKNRNLKEARELFEFIIEDLHRNSLLFSPIYRSSVQYLVNIYIRTSELDEALKFIEAQSDKFINHQDLAIYKLEVLLKTGELEEVNALIINFHKKSSVLNQDLRFLNILRKYDYNFGINQHINYLVKFYPENRRVLHVYGEWLFKTKDFRKASEVYANILEKSKTDFRALKMYSILLHKISDNSSLAKLAQLNEYYPSDFNVKFYYILLLIKYNKYPYAKSLAIKALNELDHSNSIETVGCIELLMAVKLYREAELIINKTKNSFINNISYLLASINLFRSCGKINNAYEYIHQLRNVDIKRLTVHHHRIEASFHLLNNYLIKKSYNNDLITTPEAPYKILVELTEDLNNNCFSEKIMIINATLGAGGAERQVTNTLLGIKKYYPEIAENIVLVCENLDSSLGRDFYHSALINNSINVIDCTDLDWRAIMRKLDYEGNIDKLTLKLIKSLPDDLLRLTVQYYNQIIKHKPKVIHLWQDKTNICGGIAALIAGVPKIFFSVRSTRPELSDRNEHYLKSLYQNILNNDRVILTGNSKAVVEDYLAWLELNNKNTKIIYNGIDVEELKRNLNSESSKNLLYKNNVPDDAFIVGGIMRLSEVKRPELWIDVALETCKLHNDIYFLLAGDGYLMEDLLKKINESEYKERIILLGNVRPVEPFIDILDILILTSMTEGLPNVLIEAQSLGVPVISSDAGGSREAVLEDKTGVVLDNDSVQEFVNKISEFYLNNDLLSKMKHLSPSFIEKKFGIKTMIDSTLSLYNS